MDEALKKRWRDSITQTVIIIGKQLNMEKNDQILMLMSLNTPRKINAFMNWAENHTKNNRIESTPMKVLSAATRIGRGMDPLPDEAYEE